MRKQIITSLLLLSMLLSSCSSGDAGQSASTSAAASTVAESTTAAETELSDDLPEMDFKGYDFKMYMRNNDDFTIDMYAKEESGDLMNDAIFDRNRTVGERFGVTFSLLRSADTTAADAAKSILAGEDAYDIIVPHARAAFTYGQAKQLLEWNTELKYVDLDRPWWNQDARANFSMNHKLYTMIGDISYLNLGSTNAMLFNKAMFKNLGINDIYDTVTSGEWVFDKFAKLALLGSKDLNGDSKIDIEHDSYGYATGHWKGPIQVLYTAGLRICEKDKNDKIYITLNNERTSVVFEKFFALTDSDAGYIHLENGSTLTDKAFIENRAMFIDPGINGLTNLRDMEADFGIIPWPKFDETVDEYYTNVDAGCNLICVPITAGNPERTSVVLEALCAEGYRTVLPTYYEVALQTKYTRDDESVQMLDIIRAGRVFDIGYFYSNSAFVYEVNSIGRFLAHETDHTFTTFYAKYESQAQEKIKLINEAYEK